MSSLLNDNKIKVPYIRDLSHSLNKMYQKGYTENFKVAEDGLLLSLDSNKKYKPEEICLVNFYRAEGISDPDDNSILYIIEADDGTKGTLMDAYGAYSDPLVENFMKQVKRSEKNDD